MKKILFLALIISALFLTSFAQSNFSKDYKGDYIATVMFTGVNQSVGDTTDYYYVPSDVLGMVYFIKVDTISASDAITNVIVEHSPDKVTFIPIDTLTTSISAAGNLRFQKSSTYPGPYLRLRFAVTGSGVAHDFKIFAIPKKD